MINSEGRLTGVIAIDCSNANINEQLSTKYRYTSQRSFLVNPQGIILAHPDENEINDSVQSRIDEKVWSEIVSGDRNYAMEMGAGREERASEIAGTGLASLVISGTVIAVIVLLFLEQFLHLFGATKDVLPYALDYTGITAFGLPFFVLTTVK